MFNDLTIIGLLQKGGVTVIVLLIFSLISIAVMLERAWAFRRFRLGIKESYGRLSRTLEEGGAAVAAALCEKESGPLAKVYLAGYAKTAKGRDAVERAMELAGRAEIAGLERFLGVLGTIGSTAPFVGLFGTVIGIIRAFSDLAVSQGASPAAVADGIAEALVATATGLFVAVPAVMAYNYFVRATSRYALTLETEAAEFTEAFLAGKKIEVKGGLEP
ncbi:MAG: MotA/TolQ/ExbB proton channel family protein [Deltaproteobacteria bacterium]|nr:MotA/TolQ/ExbB proton channel family protein [Deltaproteobacteria bacterium]